MKLDIKDLDKLQDGIQDLVQTGLQKGVDGLNKGLDYINSLDENGNPTKNTNGATAGKTPSEGAPAVCANCGAKLDLSSGADVIVCEYCGSSYDNKKGNDTVNTILNFVEKQQAKMEEKIDHDKVEKRIEKLQKEKEHLEREVHKKRKRRFKLPIILIILVALYYYLSNGFSIPFDQVIQSLPFVVQ